MDDFARIIANTLEVVALVIILVGALFATGSRGRSERAIILSLELLVAADIIVAVAIEPSFTNIGVLLAIIAILIFLSSSIEVETEVRWSWQDTPTAIGRGR